MSKKKKAVVIVKGGDEMHKLFDDYGFTTVDHDEDRWFFHSSDLIVFTGGADVTPFLYGEKVHRATRISMKRDLEEIELFNDAPWNIPRFGICRGFQFLATRASVGLYQDVTHHAGCNHTVLNCETNKRFMAPSTHHQMVYPMPGDPRMVVTHRAELANVTGECMWEGRAAKQSITPELQVEGGLFPFARSAGVQFHPEYTSASELARKEVFDMITTRLGVHV